MQLYIGNLSKDVTESDLYTLISQIASVKTINLVRDSENSESRGFAFIDMLVDEDASKIILYLNTKLYHDRVLHVKEARAHNVSPRDTW